MFKNSFYNDDFSLCLAQNDKNSDKKFSTLCCEEGSEFDMIDELTDYDMLTQIQLQSRCKEAEDKCKYLERKFSEIKNERNAVEESSLDSADKNRHLITEIEELKELNVQLINEKKILQRNIIKMNKEHSTEIENLEDSIEDLKNGFKDWQKKHKDKVKEVQEDYDKEELNNVRKKLKEINKDMKRKDDEIEDMKENIEDFEKKMKGIKGDCQKYSLELENQNGVNENLRKIIEDLRIQVQEKEEIIYELKSNIKEDIQLENKQAVIVRLMEENSKIIEVNKSLEKYLSSSKDEILRLQAKFEKNDKQSNKTYPIWWMKHMT